MNKHSGPEVVNVMLFWRLKEIFRPASFENASNHSNANSLFTRWRPDKTLVSLSGGLGVGGLYVEQWIPFHAP